MSNTNIILGKLQTQKLQITSGATTGYVLTSDVSGNAIWAAISSAVPQTDIIYVDSVNGADNGDTNRGNIEKPYATVEYVLANTNNTGTVVGDTTNGSATITNVSDTTNIKVGQYITGTNIPYNSIVVSKTSNTIVLNQVSTGTATSSTITYWTIKTIKVVNDIVATSNWYKPGYWFDCGDSNITWGNFILFSRSTATLVPEIIKGGNWYGNHSSSVFMGKPVFAVSSNHDIFIDIISYLSLGTGYQIEFSNTPTACRNFVVNCNSFEARFGYIAIVGNVNSQWSGYKYGLLGGLTGIKNVYGKTECPASVNAIVLGQDKGAIYGIVNGSVNLGYYSEVVINDFVIGTNFVANCDSLICNSHIRVTSATIGSGRGNCTFNGQTTGTFTCDGNTVFDSFGGNFVASSGNHILTLSDNYHSGVGAITTSGTADLILKGKNYNSSVYGSMVLNIGSGSKITNYATIKVTFQSNFAGTLINYGFIALNYNNNLVPLTGTFENRGDFELVRGGHGEDSNYTPSFVISTGALILNGGKFFCNVADSKSGLIRKTASGGKLILRNQPYLKVANGLAPLQILSNTGTAEDVMDFSMIGNGAAGFRLSDTFSDTTYGTTYAPNLLVGGTAYEDTTYSF